MSVPRCWCAQAAISVVRNPLTTDNFTRNGCPSSVVWTAATNGVFAGETVKVLSRASIETMAGFIDESGW